jgi:hypothetical protein
VHSALILIVVAWPAVGGFATGKAKANTPTMLLAMVSVSVFVASILRRSGGRVPLSPFAKAKLNCENDPFAKATLCPLLVVADPLPLDCVSNYY